MTDQEFTPLDYLRMDIAARFGLDKETWVTRQIWFEMNQHKLDSLVQSAKEPAMYMAGVQAYRKVLAGQPTGFGVSLDATASGMQLLSVMARDKKGCELSNVFNTGTVKDFYNEMYDAMTSVVQGIDREDVKKAVMQSFYGGVRTAKNVFGDSFSEYIEMVGKTVPQAWNLNQVLLDMADPNVDEYNWTLPDGFNVKVDVYNSVVSSFDFMNRRQEIVQKIKSPTDWDKSLAANSTHSVEAYIAREVVRRARFTKEQLAGRSNSPDKVWDSQVRKIWKEYEATNMLSARILDYITPYNIRYVDEGVLMELVDKIPEESFSVLTTHDCFRSSPLYAEHLRNITKELYAELGNSTLIDHIITTITGVNNYYESEDISDEIRKSSYIIC